MNDILKFGAVIVIAVIALALAIRLVVGFVLGLLVPLVLIGVILVLAYWLFAGRGDETQ